VHDHKSQVYKIELRTLYTDFCFYVFYNLIYVGRLVDNIKQIWQIDHINTFVYIYTYVCVW